MQNYVYFLSYYIVSNVQSFSSNSLIELRLSWDHMRFLLPENGIDNSENIHDQKQIINEI